MPAVGVVGRLRIAAIGSYPPIAVFAAPVFTLFCIFFRDSVPEILKSPINTGALAMLAGLVVVPVVDLIARRPDAKIVNGAFACYERKIVVSQSTALGDRTVN